MTNRLGNAASPYLLQHAHNPVDWFPWGDEALEKARREQKLILVSIGYAACHWCHVMERESFTQAKVGEILNRSYVSIKVDREERPDVDAHFMERLVALTGQGGWPLNMFLTPDLQPLHGGTYFPPEPRAGRPGFTQVLEWLAERWANDRTALQQEQQNMLHHLEQSLPLPRFGPNSHPHLPSGAWQQETLEYWQDRMDPVFGGLGIQPKFPQPVILSFLLRQAVQQQDQELQEQLLQTLDQMAAGGIRDQLGGAFHRYAVDRQWLVPHFEIMLYDNALLARLYLEAWQAWGYARHAHVARGILQAMVRDFRLPDGGYISSLDADSANENNQSVEGYYYTWLPEELVAELGAQDAQSIITHYLTQPRGLAEGRFTLRLGTDITQLDTVEHTLAPLRHRLFQLRSQRPPPARDDKVLTSWNGLLLSALALGGTLLADPDLLQQARNLAEHLLQVPWQQGHLVHCRRQGVMNEACFLEDHAYLLQGVLDLYEADYAPRWLTAAESLAETLEARFATHPDLPWVMTPVETTTPLPSRMELDDGVLPSPNAAALVGLSRLALLTGREAWQERCTRIRNNLALYLARQPAGGAELSRAWALAPEQAVIVEIVGAWEDPRTQALLTAAARHALPGMVRRWQPTTAPLPKTLHLATIPPDDAPKAYVCSHCQCQQPVTLPAGLIALLEPKYSSTS
ncbi:MAG: thioredoxin domain-containing protein [Magnetococcales bacterium]|nr:thioredoxin domain-containing protein [Magnetococcales bacterium]